MSAASAPALESRPMDPSSLEVFLGRLHPLTVHFPIALLTFGALWELPRRERPTQAGLVCLAFGALSAGLAAWFGWLHADAEPLGRSLDDTVFYHRWSGVAVAGVGLLTVLVAFAMRRGFSQGGRKLYRGLLLLGLGLVTWTGHLGGTLVYGEGYLLEPWRDRGSSVTPRDAAPAAPDPPEPEPVAAEPVEAGPVEPEPADPEPTPVAEGEAAPVEDPGPAPPAASAVDYATQIQPLFEATCYECHGPTGRPRGGLRLNDMADVFAGDPIDWVIQPGNARASLLYERITLPPEHEDVMPADGDPLTEEQVRLVREWIDAGAEWAPVPADASEGEGL